MTNDLYRRHSLEAPTYDAVAALVARLRDDLALAEQALGDLRQAEITALEARLAALRASEPARGKPKRQKPADEALPAVEVILVPAAAPPEPDVQGHRCPHCPKMFGSAHALGVHIGRSHKHAPEQLEAEVRAALAAVLTPADGEPENPAQEAEGPKALALP